MCEKADSQILVLSEVVVHLLQSSVSCERERDGFGGAGDTVLFLLCLKGVCVDSISIIEHHVVLEGPAATVDKEMIPMVMVDQLRLA